MLRRLFRTRAKAEPRAANRVMAPPGQVIVYRTDDGDIMINDRGEVSWLTGASVEEPPMTRAQALAETVDLEARISALHEANEIMELASNRYEAAYCRCLKALNLRRMRKDRRKELEADLLAIFQRAS